MIRLLFLIFTILIITLGPGCDLIEFKEQKQAKKNNKVLARVNGQELTQSRIRNIIPEYSFKNGDSSEIINRYINSWIRKKLLLNKAEESIDFNEKELKRKIRNYEYELKVHAFKKQYIENNLDTTLNSKEVREYYKNHTKEFELKQNIVRGAYIKIPVEAPNQRSMRGWLKKGKYEKLRSYCMRYANTYVINDSSWIKFDDLILNTPFQDIENKVQFLKRHGYSKRTDSAFHHFLKTDDYKIRDEIAPLPMVEDRVRSILINKRKVKLINALEKSVYNQAKKENAFEIYYNQ